MSTRRNCIYRSSANIDNIRFFSDLVEFKPAMYVQGEGFLKKHPCINEQSAKNMASHISPVENDVDLMTRFTWLTNRELWAFQVDTFWNLLDEIWGKHSCCLWKGTTVDGQNPANELRLVVSPLFTGFYTSQVVVWDFFHQQYVVIMSQKQSGWASGVFVVSVSNSFKWGSMNWRGASFLEMAPSTKETMGKWSKKYSKMMDVIKTLHSI